MAKTAKKEKAGTAANVAAAGAEGPPRSVVIHRAIVKAMDRAKMNSYELWKKSGVPRTVVYSFVNGERNISLPHVEKLMKTLGITLELPAK